MSSKLDTRVIQVTNVSPATTKEQMKTLFQYIGRIRECKLFPPEGSDQQVAAKVCYVEFEDSTSAGVSLHLSNTVFIDRALCIVPVMEGKIPDERVAFQLTPQTVARMGSGQPSWPANVVSQLAGTGNGQVITTYDPRLNALGLPQYPPLPSTLDAAKVEEIRRTVYIGNLDSKTSPESLITFFSQAGEVKYVRMAGDDDSVPRAAYLELSDQRSVATYLGYNGVTFNGRIITVSHAKSCINKPLSKSQEATQREVEDAMKKVAEAQSLISAAAGGDKHKNRSRSRSRKRSRSRSRSRSRKRSRSRSRGRRRRSRSRSKKKSRSPRRGPRRSRSRSPRRRRSRSRSGFVVIPAREKTAQQFRRRRSRSKSRSKRRSRSRSKRHSRTPPRAYNARRSKSRSRGPKRKSRSRTPRRSRSRSRGKGKDKKERGKDSEKKKKEKKGSVSRSPSPPTLKREGSAAPRSGDDRSPARLIDSSKEETVKPSELEAVSSAALTSGAKKGRSGAANEKESSQKRDRSGSPVPRRKGRSESRSPVKKRRSRSRSPVKISRRRSISPRKRRTISRSPRRSRSPAKKRKKPVVLVDPAVVLDTDQGKTRRRSAARARIARRRTRRRRAKRRKRTGRKVHPAS